VLYCVGGNGNVKQWPVCMLLPDNLCMHAIYNPVHLLCSGVVSDEYFY
jgi:hypothetical protein